MARLSLREANKIFRQGRYEANLLKRKAKRAKRVALLQQRRENKAALRAARHRTYLLTIAESKRRRDLIGNASAPYVGQIALGYDYEASPRTEPVYGTLWQRTHSETYRRKKPTEIVHGYYTAIAASSQWSNAVTGRYSLKWGWWSRESYIVEGTLIAPLSKYPLQQLGLLEQVHGMGTGWYPKSPVELLSQVANSVLKQVQSRKLDLTVAIGEGRETLAFLKKSHQDVSRLVDTMLSKEGNPGKRFMKLVNTHPRTLEKMTRQQAKAFTKANPDFRWLEYNFALLPFVADVQGAAEVMAAHYAPKLKVLHAASSARKQEVMEYRELIGAIQTGYQACYRGEVFWRCVNRVDYVVEDSQLKALSELGITNPGASMYAMKALSFVADWLVPIGDFLSLWDATLGCNLIAAYQGCSMHTMMDISIEKTYTPRIVAISDVTPATYGYRGYVRRNSTVFPYPSLYVKNPFSVWTALTGAALYKQRLKPPHLRF